MDGLIIFLKLLPDSIKLGLIYSIMVMGVYITYKILDFPDLTVDGSFPLGSFIFSAMVIFYELHPFFGIIIAGISGMIAGFITGILHIKFKINKLLSGILTMSALYSINARILGKPNAFLENNQSWFYIINFEKYFYIFLIISIIVSILKLIYDRRIKPDKYVLKSYLIYLFVYFSFLIYIYITKDIAMFLIALVVLIIKTIMDYILTSKFGFMLRALGDNEILVSSLGVSVNKIKILGLMLSNALVSISGAFLTQYIKIVDLSSSVGTIIIGLASIIFGVGLIKKSRLINYISIVIFGSIIYYIIINFAINSSALTDEIYYLFGLSDNLIDKLRIKPTDVKIITSIFLALILAFGKKRGKKDA